MHETNSDGSSNTAQTYYPYDNQEEFKGLSMNDATLNMFFITNYEKLRAPSINFATPT